MHWCLLGTAHRAFGNYVLIQCPSGRNRLWQNFFTRGAERYLQVETYEVRPAYAGGRKLNAAVSVPGSKSITNRALMLAALADGTTTLRGALMSDDSRAFIGCLQNLGFPVEADEEKKTVRVTGFGGTIPKKEASINVGSAGTAARFITALLGFVPGIWHLDASEQMKKRPMKPLLRSLETLGSRIEYHGEPGFFPFTIHSDGVKTDEVSVNIDDSSQFLSALMMASLTLKRPFVIRVLGSHGLSYVQMTVKLMRDFGAEVKEISSENSRSPLCLSISLPGQLRTGAFDVEPDVSAAAYFYAWKKWAAPLQNPPMEFPFRAPPAAVFTLSRPTFTPSPTRRSRSPRLPRLQTVPSPYKISATSVSRNVTEFTQLPLICPRWE